MTITRTLQLFAVMMYLLCMAGIVIAIWTANRTAYFNQRIELAQTAYEQHLQMSSYTYGLFKQYGDALLVGDSDRGAGEALLIAKIRENIRNIRRVIGQEIELVGEEELEELELLAKMERQLEELITKFTAVVSNETDLLADENRAALSVILENDIDRDFRSMMDEALAEELEEVTETRQMMAGHIAFSKRLAVVFAVLALAVTGVVLWMHIRKIATPMTRLIDGVERFRQGNFDNPIVIDSRDELARAATVLNEMAEQVNARTKGLTDKNSQLERAVAERTQELERLLIEARDAEVNQRRLLADVSHELRTPLTIIKGESDIALRGGEKTTEIYKEALTRTQQAAAHTARLVDDFLFVAREEQGVARLRVEQIDLTVLLGETLSMVSPDLMLETDLAAAPASADSVRLRQSILALIQNASVHGGHDIAVRLHRATDGYRIDVADRGPGMTKADQEHAFERFFRGSNAAETYRDGTGLGLPVVKSIIEAHGGSVSLHSPTGGGTVVTLLLPASASALGVAV